MSRRRTVVAAVAATCLLAPPAWLWQASLLPDSYSAAAMGFPEHGSGHPHAATGAGAAEPRSLVSLTAPGDRVADVTVDLVTRAETFRLAPDLTVDGFTLNGASPGPVIRAREGDLVEARLVNESVPDGVTLHWHGVDVPNAADGVAGVTQDAVPAGDEFVYRFVADRAGTYWYHAHQLSHEQVRKGLLGALVVEPAADAAEQVVPASTGGPAEAPARDVVALVHLYDGVRTVNGAPGDSHVDAAPGSRVRVRVINTDNGPMPVWVDGAPFRLVAIDGTDVVDPGLVEDAWVQVTAGGRADLVVDTPADGAGARVQLGGSATLVLGPDGASPASAARPERLVDPLTYGTPAGLGFDPAAATRRFEYAIGRRPGFVDGVPGIWWTVNGHLYPDVPMFMVTEGDVVRMRISNRSGEVHPMHLHGHHAVVLSRDGEPATGSPWVVDSLNVGVDESYEIAFVADNPGIWMDHCHNLPHAAEGLVAHLMYEGVTTPFLVGGTNRPE